MSGATPPAIRSEEAGGELTIDLGALAANYRDLAQRVGSAECAAVVKADAYGTGLEQAATALWRAGARTFFVAVMSEARRLRATLPEATIYVLNGLPPGTEAAFAGHDLRPVLGSRDEIDAWNGFCAATGQRFPAAVHADTGMNRLGLSPMEAVGFIDNAGEIAFELALLMSHLACADEPDHPLTQRQIEDFRILSALLPGVPASLANSAATLALPEAHFDMVRPGIALYGGRSRAGTAPLRPVVRLELRIIQLREVRAGETVGYGGVETARRESRVAIISAGYADGIPRLAGSSDGRKGAEAIVAGRRCPLMGRISMDMLAIDVTDVPPGDVAAGDHAVLLGDGLTVDDLAVHAHSIGYEVLTGLGRRYHRRWV